MKLYEITNGFMGYSYVRGLVVAENEDEAYRIGSEMFEKEARRDEREIKNEQEFYKRTGRPIEEVKTHDYNKKYWENLEIKCLFDDLTAAQHKFLGD